MSRRTGNPIPERKLRRDGTTVPLPIDTGRALRFVGLAPEVSWERMEVEESRREVVVVTSASNAAGQRVVYHLASGTVTTQLLFRVSELRKHAQRYIGRCRRELRHMFPGYMRFKKPTDLEVVHISNALNHARNLSGFKPEIRWVSLLRCGTTVSVYHPIKSPIWEQAVRCFGSCYRIDGDDQFVFEGPGLAFGYDENIQKAVVWATK